MITKKGREAIYMNFINSMREGNSEYYTLTKIQFGSGISENTEETEA